MIRKFRHKGTGQTVHAVKLTTDLVKDVETLAKLPSGFRAFDQVSPNGRFAYGGTCGSIGQWFIYPAINRRQWFVPETMIWNNFEEPEVAPPEPTPYPERNNALEFELAIKQVIAEQMAEGLTVTEAVGTLQLCSMDIANQFFNNTTPV